MKAKAFDLETYKNRISPLSMVQVKPEVKKSVMDLEDKAAKLEGAGMVHAAERLRRQANTLLIKAGSPELAKPMSSSELHNAQKARMKK